jgi:hypothetical protein
MGINMSPTACAMGTAPNQFGQTTSLPWLRVWMLAVMVFAGSVGSLEAYWRSQGFRPTVADSMDLWHFWRQRVDRDDGKVIVFLGSSRITADISIDTMRECLGNYRVVQLGMSGAVSCIGLLQELIADPKFNGTVVCELDTPLLERSLWEGHRDFRTYRPRSLRTYFEGLAWASLADHLVVLQYPLTLEEVFARFINDGPMSGRDKLRIRFRREIQWDFSKVPDLDEFRHKTTQEYKQRYEAYQFPTWDALAKDIEAINVMVRKLQMRGGQVVFLRAPSTGERWRLEDRFHPKKTNWERFAASTEAICIHFRDVPGIAGLSCPDESHLDYRDAPELTRALVRELTSRGWNR